MIELLTCLTRSDQVIRIFFLSLEHLFELKFLRLQQKSHYPANIVNEEQKHTSYILLLMRIKREREEEREKTFLDMHFYLKIQKVSPFATV